MSGYGSGRSPRLFLLTGILLTIFGCPASSQMANTLTASLANHMEYSYATETGQEILENWLDVDFYLDNFTTGLRMELYQPKDPTLHFPGSDPVEEGVTFRYVEYHRDNIEARFGNYYAMFGRGLVLRSYEDRNTRVDTNLEGVSFDIAYDRLSATFLSGRPKDPAGDRIDLLHGTDVNLNPVGGLSLGGSYMINRPIPENREKAKIASGRVEFSLSNSNLVWDVYGEYGERTNPRGKGAYVSSSFTTAGFGLSLEYKYYDRFFFQTENELVTYNNPPALVREHAYTLLNRDPHELDADDEVGIQVEATYSPDQNTSIVANYSLTRDNDNTMWGGKKTLYEEGYTEIEHHFSDAFSSIGAISASEKESDTYITPIFESIYSFDPVNSLRFVFQHRHTKSHSFGEFDNQMYSLEYARSPRFTLSLVGEWTNMSELQKKRKQVSDRNNVWLFGQLDVNISPNHDLSLMYGSRQAGFICAGGVCRFEPEFEGIEVKLYSRL